jgi:hypothetical protein
VSSVEEVVQATRERLGSVGVWSGVLNAAPVGDDRLVDAIVAWGDEQAIADRVGELRASGADHVILQPLAEDLQGVIEQLERLAPVLAR